MSAEPATSANDASPDQFEPKVSPTEVPTDEKTLSLLRGGCIPACLVPALLRSNRLRLDKAKSGEKRPEMKFASFLLSDKRTSKRLSLMLTGGGEIPYGFSEPFSNKEKGQAAETTSGSSGSNKYTVTLNLENEQEIEAGTALNSHAFAKCISEGWRTDKRGQKLKDPRMLEETFSGFFRAIRLVTNKETKEKHPTPDPHVKVNLPMNEVTQLPDFSKMQVVEYGGPKGKLLSLEDMKSPYKGGLLRRWIAAEIELHYVYSMTANWGFTTVLKRLLVDQGTSQEDVVNLMTELPYLPSSGVNLDDAMKTLLETGDAADPTNSATAAPQTNGAAAHSGAVADSEYAAFGKQLDAGQRDTEDPARAVARQMALAAAAASVPMDQDNEEDHALEIAMSAAAHMADLAQTSTASGDQEAVLASGSLKRTHEQAQTESEEQSSTTTTTTKHSPKPAAAAGPKAKKRKVGTASASQAAGATKAKV